MSLTKEAALRLAGQCLPALLGSDAAKPEKVSGLRSVANLWAGMGAVYQVDVSLAIPVTEGAAGAKRAKALSGTATFMIKHIRLPQDCSSVGDARKKASYDVEAAFYQHHAPRLLAAGLGLPRPLHIERPSGSSDELLICMTQLEGARSRAVGRTCVLAALRWLAQLHAEYWGAARADEAVESGLQAQGCYWYLDTRQEELAAMPRTGWEGRLRRAAVALDMRLKADRCQTVCHGDAKDANMMFSGDGSEVFMYDFQYVGKAPATKDLAYCLLCASDSMTPAQEQELLAEYVSFLTANLTALGRGDEAPTLQQITDSYDLAVCDLARWMSGWGWWGHQAVMKRRCEGVLRRLDGGADLGSDEAYVKRVFEEYPP